MQITITRETKKAALITNGERTGWVQKRWLKDGQVSDKVFEKAASEYESREAERAAQADIQAARGDATICDLWNAQVFTRHQGAAIFIKTTNANTNAVTFYKLGYRVDPATGAATCVEDIVVPGYPRP